MCVCDCVHACVCVRVCVAKGCTYIFDSLGSEGVKEMMKTKSRLLPMIIILQ